MKLPTINVFNFLSIEPFLSKKVLETNGFNMLHNDILHCYYTMAEGADMYDICERLVATAEVTSENENLIRSSWEYLNAVRKLHLQDDLLN
jgi:hypothetical protein